jgi:hypothetical protein
MKTYNKKKYMIKLCCILTFTIIIGMLNGCKTSLNTSSKISASDSGNISNQTSSRDLSKTGGYIKSDLFLIQSAILKKATGNTFTVSNNQLFFSYDNGKYKAEFPAQLTSEIFYKDIQDFQYGFYISPSKTAVACLENNALVIYYSNNMGKTWNHSSPILPSDIPFRNSPGAGTLKDFSLVGCVCIDFPTNNCGYLLISGTSLHTQQRDRVIFKTTDGGKTWRFVDPHLSINNETGFWVDSTYDPYSSTQFIVTSGYNSFTMKFLNENLGFFGGYVSTSDYGYDIPFYHTTDGGLTATEIKLSVPEKYHKYAYGNHVLQPYFINNKGYLPVYLCTNYNVPYTVIYYTSTDNGVTWTYDSSMDKLATDILK